MHITVQRQALLDTLTRVSAVVPRKSSLSICCTVLMQAKDGKLTIIGTNLGETLIAECKARVEKGGEVCTYPEPLMKFLKAVDTASVIITGGTKKESYDSSEYKEVEQPDGTKKYDSVPIKKTREVAKFSLQAGDSSVNLAAESAKDFPPVPKYQMPTKHISDLADVLEQVTYAAATDEVRPVLAGICLRPNKGKMGVAAADGFRMATTSIRNPGVFDKDTILTQGAVSIIRKQMPGKVLAGVTNTAKKGNPEIRVLVFANKEVTMLTRPIEGTYPEYEKLVPKGGKLFRCASDALRKSLSQVLSIAPKDQCLRMKTKGQKLILSIKDSDKEAQQSIPARGRLQIAFEAKYVKDLLAHLDGEFSIRWTTDQAPIVAKYNGTTHLVMPRHVQW